MSKKLTAEELKVVQDHMKKAIYLSASERETFIAATISDVYDVELPISPIVEAIADIRRADVGEHVYYLVPTTITKKVNILTSNCQVTQQQVHPNTRSELAFTSMLSPEFYVCLDEWLKGDHDVLKFYADSITEAMNRQEIYAVLQLLEAGISATGGTNNTYGPESGHTAITFPVLVSMLRSLAKYGNNFVLVSGANVTTDLLLMDFRADTFRKYGLDNLNITQMTIEDYQVTVTGSSKNVIDPDVAYLVAISDSSQRKPIIFSRRKLAAIVAPDTQIDATKERAIIDTGNMINVSTDRLFSKGKAGFQSYGAVLLNERVVAKFDNNG